MWASVWVNIVDGWLLKMLATYPANDPSSTNAELFGAMQWTTNAADILNLSGPMHIVTEDR